VEEDKQVKLSAKDLLDHNLNVPEEEISNRFLRQLVPWQRIPTNS
jgi:hypothetical protein